jgi:general secretion pathway protein A
MYTEFYGLTANPFQMTPDPLFYFESSNHRRAMAYLLLGLEQSEGFIVITGDVGAGKTTLLEHLLRRLDPKAYVTAKVVSSHLQSDDMLRAVAAAFGLPFQGLDKATLLTRIKNFLDSNFNKGLRTLLLVDEAQNVPPPALEELRMLSNFQVGSQVPLQGILMGQPQFRRLLANPDLEQFRQRIVASHHLGPIGAAETREYIRYRLTVVGWKNNPEFTEEAFAEIYNNTGGVPRKINMFCTRLMLFGFLDELRRIDIEAVRAVADDLALEVGQSLEATREHLSAGVMHHATRVTETSAGQFEHRLDKLEQTVAKHSRTIKFFTMLVEHNLPGDDPHD